MQSPRDLSRWQIELEPNGCSEVVDGDVTKEAKTGPCREMREVDEAIIREATGSVLPSKGRRLRKRGRAIQATEILPGLDQGGSVEMIKQVWPNSKNFSGGSH